MNDDRLNKFEFITEGPILTSMFKLALPIMISQLMQTLYNLADTVWVGRVGARAVAAISISFPLVFMMIAVAAGLTIAGTSLIAQYKGANSYERLDKILGQLFSFVGLISVIVAVVGIILSKKMLYWMGADEVIIQEAVDYLRIIFAGTPFMFGFFIFSSTLRGIGDTVTPTIMTVVSVILNLILDPLLIFGIGPFMELGIGGAAVATVFSRAVVTIYGLGILVRGSKGLKLRFSNMILDFEIIKNIIKIGLPSSIEQSMMALGQILMTSLVTSFGTMTLAAYGIVNRIISLPTILAFGLSAAATTMVGQNLGADKQQRAEKIALISVVIIFISLSLIGITMLINPELIVSLFNSEPQVLKYGTDFLTIAALSFGFIGVMNVANGVFKGAGRTIPPMIISTLSLWIFKIPLGYLLAYTFDWQQMGIWWAVAIANLVGALLAVVWLRTADWNEKIIEDKSSLQLVLQEE